jgi:uncharacterized membrane protein
MNIPQRIKQYLLNGFFVLIPISCSVLVVWWVVQLVDRSVAPLLAGIVGRDIPGMGLAFAFVIVLAAGILVSDALGQRLLELAEEGLMQVPGFRWVYQTIKQVADAFSPESQASYKKVVLVEYPRPGVWRLGFVTSEVSVKNGSGADEKVAVYVPTNHFYFGDIVLFKRTDVRITDLDVQKGIQACLSGGAALPPVLDAKPFA